MNIMVAPSRPWFVVVSGMLGRPASLPPSGPGIDRTPQCLRKTRISLKLLLGDINGQGLMKDFLKAGKDAAFCYKCIPSCH
jgi:hypothetical protein